MVHYAKYFKPLASLRGSIIVIILVKFQTNLKIHIKMRIYFAGMANVFKQSDITIINSYTQFNIYLALTFIVLLRWLRYQENFSPGRKGKKSGWDDYEVAACFQRERKGP